MTNNIRVETEKLQLAVKISKLLEACYLSGLDPDQASEVSSRFFKEVESPLYNAAVEEAKDMISANPDWGKE